MATIRCDFENCRYRGADGECTRRVPVHLDEDGACISAKYIHVCGECIYYGTEQCGTQGTDIRKLIDRDDSVCDRFRPKPARQDGAEG